MIKFIRKIRQKLLTENKFRKYLLYAIGEIVLVVIGILIALQINNWNEDRKERIVEKKIYENLLSDIKEDIIIIKERIALSKREKKALYNHVHNAYQTQKSTVDLIKLNSPVKWNADNEDTFNRFLGVISWVFHN